MGREKGVALVSLCLVLVFAGLSTWLYVRTRDLENRMSGLESKINDLTDQHQGLQSQFTEFASIFSQTEQLSLVSLTWQAENANVTFTVKNTGDSNLAMIAVFVNNQITKMTALTTLLSPGAQATVTVTRAGGFTSGMKYEFTFITASGNQFMYVATAP